MLAHAVAVVPGTAGCVASANPPVHANVPQARRGMKPPPTSGKELGVFGLMEVDLFAGSPVQGVPASKTSEAELGWWPTPYPSTSP